MKSAKFITAFILLISIFSCKNDNKKENFQNNTKNEMIEKILNKQVKQGANKYISEAGVETPNEEFEISELDAVVEILKKTLTSNNYNFIKQDEFAIKINKIFGRTVDFNSDKNYLYINNFDKCDREFNFYPFNGIDYNGTYIIKKERFITNFYFIPELIDYQKQYPAILEIENNVCTNYTDKEKNNYSVELWKSIPNLSKSREINIQIITNRNKYLFNDSKASLAWLQFNDEYFLQSLVKTFGYVQDEQLSKFVLNKNLKDNEGFGQVIWNKDCSGKLIFHNEIIDLINKEIPENQKIYIAAIYRYFEYLRDNPKKEIDLTFSEKCEIQGKLAYTASKIAEKINDGPYSYYSFFTFLNDEKNQVEFEKRNYYNIKDFKEVYDDTKTGGITYFGMPE